MEEPSEMPAGYWKSGDEGIDGVIKEDRLGLDAIYLQAKKVGKYGRPTGNSEICRGIAGPTGKKRNFYHHFEFLQRGL